jgi:hypothetical protein
MTNFKTMKYIITEEQNARLYIRRRLPEIWELITHSYAYMYPCDYDSLIIFLMGVRNDIFTVLSLDWFEKFDKDLIWEITDDVYQNKLVEHYLDNCREVGF